MMLPASGTKYKMAAASANPSRAVNARIMLPTSPLRRSRNVRELGSAHAPAPDANPMLISRKHLDGIAAGQIDRAFRRWKRPTVRAGGTLRTSIGLLAIDAVETLTDRDVTEEDARLAGFE